MRIEPYFWIRAAGFPFSWLDELACPDGAAAARRLAEVTGELDELAPLLAGEIAAAFPRGHDKATRALAAREPLPPSDKLPSLPRWNDAVARRRAARAGLEEQIIGELDEARRALYQRFADERVREAVFLCSRNALTMFDSMVREGVGKRASRVRYREVEATLFLQRLCSKNETVSFYGPLGWGRTGDGGDPAVVPSTARFQRRLVSFEYWAAHALAQALNADPELAAELPVRLNPACRLDGRVLHYPIDKQLTLEADTLALLEAVRGQPMRELVRDATERAGAVVVDRDLPRLLKLGILERGVLVPTMVSSPEERLLEAVRALAPSSPRDRWLLALEELCRLRDAYANATFDERVRLLGEIDQRFTAATGQEAQRGQGEVYVGRSVLYEDCCLDGTLVLGGRLTARLGRALDGVVRICRWVTRHLVGAFHEHDRRTFIGFGRAEVDLLAFMRASLSAEAPPLAEATRAQLEAAWDSVLADRDPGAVELQLGDEDLQRVLAALPAPPPAGRVVGDSFHAPDVLLAARGPEALLRGELEIVLGEIHKMVYYQAHPVGWPFCPDREEVLRRLAALVPPDLPRVMESPRLYNSRGFHLPAGSVIDVVTSGTHAREDKSLPVGELVVRELDGVLVLAHLRSSLSAPLLSVLQARLYHACDQVPPVALPPRAYLPRLRLGDIVLRRRTWRLESVELALLREAASPADALVAAAELARARGLPRRLFVKSPEEPKPIYIDLESVLSVELLIKLVRKAAWLRVSELYPDGEQLWLEVGGQRRTSELRLTCVLDDER